MKNLIPLLAVALLLISHGALAGDKYGHGHGPVGPVKPVKVVNDVLSVEGFVEVPQPQREPYQQKLALHIEAGATGNLPVCVGTPDDRWLVIQNLTAVANSSSPLDGLVLTVETEARPSGPSGIGFNHTYALPVELTLLSGVRRYGRSEQVTIYASPGSSTCYLCGRASGGPEEICQVTLDGILTDSP